MKRKAWIHALRLRTLPLALSSVVLGTFIAVSDNTFKLSVSLMAGLTALLLQILSNLANDYGDSVKGTDNINRVGPVRAVQSGVISPAEMKKAIVFFTILTFIAGFILLMCSFGTHILNSNFLVFLVIGIIAIVAAIKYTIGRNPYGYSGLGDVVVFCFFGLAGVVGTYYLNTHQFRPDVLLPASALGLLSAGVLNLNNMRDYENDKKNGKNTLVVKLGNSVAKYYHLALIAIAFCLTFIYILINFKGTPQFLFLLMLPPFVLNVRSVFVNTIPGELDSLLRQLAVSSLIFTILFGLGLIL